MELFVLAQWIAGHEGFLGAIPMKDQTKPEWGASAHGDGDSQRPD
jgi:hypothetical protein